MKFVTFRADGQTRIGAFDGATVTELTSLPAGVNDLRGLLAAVEPADLAKVEAKGKTWDLADVELLPVIPNPNKIICVGVNYRSHREETGQDPNLKPTIFTRFADTQIAHGAVVTHPSATDSFDYEGELAVIIGRDAKNMSAADAWSVVAGFAPYNDLTARDWQKHSTQWIPGKNFPETGAFGPAMVTLDEIADVPSVELTTRVNGDVRQNATLADMIFDIPALIEYITGFTPLAPGDVIVSGTPGGVGKFMTPPTYLKAGDVVEIELSGVGLLVNTIG